MNKQDLILAVAGGADLTQAQAEQAINATINFIKNCVMAGEDVNLRDFGTFTKSKHKKRVGVNPQTGKKIKIPSRFYPKFRAHTDFKSIIN